MRIYVWDAAAQHTSILVTLNTVYNKHTYFRIHFRAKDQMTSNLITVTDVYFGQKPNIDFISMSHINFGQQVDVEQSMESQKSGFTFNFLRNKDNLIVPESFVNRVRRATKLSIPCSLTPSKDITSLGNGLISAPSVAYHVKTTWARQITCPDYLIKDYTCTVQ
jgi:hypothetical protein